MIVLLNLLERNRLALVVLAASLAAGARSRARGVYAESAAVRWLARNALSVRHFLSSLSLLRRCAGWAGYRVLRRARSRQRLRSAPRRLAPPTAAAALATVMPPRAWDVGVPTATFLHP